MWKRTGLVLTRHAANWRTRSALVLALSSAGCWSGLDAAPELEGQREPQNSVGADPVVAAVVPVRARPKLRENSGAAMSRSQPGVFFTINDSGHEPELFALDTTGLDRGVWSLTGAENLDWEAVAVGPCGQPAGGAASPPASCVYIGDVGDNNATYRSRDIYRVPEPAAASRQFSGAVTPDRLVFRFQDGPRDVEAMYVGPTGTIYLITKRPLRGPDRQLRQARVYSIPLSAWANREHPATAVFSDSIPVVPGARPGGLITDAALSPDARFVAVRTYSQVYTFAADPASGRIRADVAPAVCNVVPLGERQGEGITWYGSSGKLLLTSEGRSSPLYVVACPLPGE